MAILVRAALLLTTAVGPAAAQAVPDHAQLARSLEEGNDEQRRAAVTAILKIPADQRDQALLMALIKEARRHDQRRQDRRSVLAAGGTVEPAPDHGEDLFNVLEALCQSKNPVVIEPLVLFIGSGNRVMNALKSFGELAVKEIASVVLRPDASFSAREVASALETLRRMLEGPTDPPLSDASKHLIVEVAWHRLRGMQNVVVLRRAVELAVATGDPALVEHVRTLTLSEAAVRAFGITDPDLVQSVQRTAADALNAWAPR